MTPPALLPAAGPHRAVVRLAIALAALVLTVSACAQGGPATEPTEQESTMQSSTPDPSEALSGTPAPTSGGPAPTATGTAPGSSAVAALLTVTLQQDAAAEPVQYVLECVDGAPGPASTLPGAEAACAALARLGSTFFTARPSKDIICTQQYGGPQTASISGEIDGTPVLAAFSLTDGCEISRWNKAQDILGAPGAQ
ncbi:serine protease inhibitor [Arthrobacter agilis]|uniref:Serine protease inhibitor n=1 Tax=Arthrobacter agilis TaxID=37921 RepID=A0A2L0UBA1_9MICC|nr:SSI family serine proteinase inhibitor [Arthrobacter agilis]AUZ86530.1 serine protease inhibitor [Arthrobacter agilis]